MNKPRKPQIKIEDALAGVHAERSKREVDRLNERFRRADSQFDALQKASQENYKAGKDLIEATRLGGKKADPVSRSISVKRIPGKSGFRPGWRKSK